MVGGGSSSNQNISVVWHIYSGVVMILSSHRHWSGDHVGDPKER